jgi:hypothetical protein
MIIDYSEAKERSPVDDGDNSGRLSFIPNNVRKDTGKSLAFPICSTTKRIFL